MAYGHNTVYQAVVASGTSLSAEVDFKRAYRVAYLDVTGAASEVRLQMAADSGGSYRQVYHPSINSSTVGVNIFKIASAASGGFVPIPAGMRFMKVETTAAIANGLTFKIVVSD